MCKDHDELHYSRNVREIASIASMGDRVTRDLLMKAFGAWGAAEFLLNWGDSMSSIRMDGCNQRMRAERIVLLPTWPATIENLVNRWEEECQTILDSVPW
jgi:hypothetical protein